MIFCNVMAMVFLFIYFFLREINKQIFVYIFPDISTRMDLTLSESLCGFTRVFKTLDNRNVIISTKPGEIIKHASTKQIENEGFPTHRDPFNKGRLIIIFNVEFPDSLTEANAKKIQAALPKVNKPTIPNPHEEVKLKDFDGQGQWKGGIGM